MTFIGDGYFAYSISIFIADYARDGVGWPRIGAHACGKEKYYDE
jgi:hypothetical protein